MDDHFLTTQHYIKGKFLSALEKLFSRMLGESDSLSDYRLLKWVKKQNKHNLSSVGFFKSKDNKKVVVKNIKFILKNLIYEQLINEANMLKLFSALKPRRRVRFPKVYDLIETSTEMTLVTEFIEGESLRKRDSEFKAKILEEILGDFAAMSRSINRKTLRALPKRSSMYIALSFPIYMAIVLLQDLKNTKYYIRLSYDFIINCFSLGIWKTNYIIAHKDLHSENIIISGNDAVIIDPEVSVITCAETDIAHIARYYAGEISKHDLVNLLSNVLANKEQKNNFIALTIYYSIQMMAIRRKNDPDYIEAKNYLFKYFYPIVEDINGKKLSNSERIYGFALNLIDLINGLLRINNLSWGIILCYHSISNDSWRYSTQIKNFETQLKYLKKNHRIVSLDDLLKKSRLNNNISLTFDDGYKDFINNALPLLNKYGVKGTLFVLGEPVNANREELDNNKELMSFDEIKKIKKMGWEVGFHTDTHADLTKLTESQLTREVIKGKQKLEQKLGFRLRFFAYPKGEYDKKVLQVVKKAGFEAAFTTSGGTADVKDVFSVDRICMERTVDFDQFKALISMLGTHFNKLYVSSVQLKYNLISKI